MIPAHSFTMSYSGISRTLSANLMVSPAFDISQPEKITPRPDCHEYLAIWDTGATGSVITEKVVRDCGLTAIGVVEMHGVGGTQRANQYLINVWLPNRIIIPKIIATEGKLSGTDILIGMDIICLGDFAVTNNNGKTVFSYRYPSFECIDFVKNPFKPKPALHIPRKKN